MKLHIAGTGHATIINNYNTSFVVAFWKKNKNRSAYQKICCCL